MQKWNIFAEILSNEASIVTQILLQALAFKQLKRARIDKRLFWPQISENLKFLILSGLHSHTEGNTPHLPSLRSNICLHVYGCHGDTDK